MIRFLPNILSIARLVLAFVFGILFIQDTKYQVLSLVIFIIASTSDWIDGWIARKYEVTTKFGEQIDPIADKVLTLWALFAFYFYGYIPLWCVIIIAVRDIFNSIFRNIQLSQYNVPTSITAKIKTTTQFLFVIFVVLLHTLGGYITSFDAKSVLFSPWIDYILILIVLLNIWTIIEYFIEWNNVKKIKRTTIS